MTATSRSSDGDYFVGGVAIFFGQYTCDAATLMA
jgi:hypothetical protein